MKVNAPGCKLGIPRSSRLKSPSRIRWVSRRGLRAKGTGFSVHWMPIDEASIPSSTTRLAFVVSRHSGKAHRRNRIKRRLREATRLNRDLWPVGMDVVLRAIGDKAADLRFNELSGSLRQALQTMGSPIR